MKKEAKQNPQPNGEDLTFLKQNRGGRYKWVYVVVLIFVVLSISVLVGVLLRHKAESSAKVKIVIDPVVVSEQGDTHVNGGQLINFNKINETEKYVANIDVVLSYNQYFVYNCKVTNSSKKKLYYSFEFESTVCQNATVTYKIDSQGEEAYAEALENLEIEDGQIVMLKIYFKVTDPDYNATIKGAYNFSISEKAGD